MVRTCSEYNVRLNENRETTTSQTHTLVDNVFISIILRRLIVVLKLCELQAILTSNIGHALTLKCNDMLRESWICANPWVPTHCGVGQDSLLVTWHSRIIRSGFRISSDAYKPVLSKVIEQWEKKWLLYIETKTQSQNEPWHNYKQLFDYGNWN